MSTRISAGDVSAILGLSPWKSAYQYYCERKGLVERPQIDSERLRMGIYAEKALDEYCRHELGWNVRRGDKRGRYHSKIPYLYGKIDRLLVEDNRSKAVLEYKNIDAFARKVWESDGIPPYYESQCRAYSMIHGMPAKLVACFGGNSVEIYDIDRDPEIEAYLQHKIEDFWERLINNNPPHPDGSASSTEALQRMYPKTFGDLKPGTPQVVELCEHYELLRSEEKSAKEKKDEVANLIRQEIGLSQCDGFILPDGGRATWKKSADSSSFDFETFSADYPELAAKYRTVKEGQRRLFVNLKKKGA